MKCETYNENGVEYIEADGERHALGLNADRTDYACRTLSQYMELPSREQLIERIESPTFGFGRKRYDSSWTINQNGWGKCASSAATYVVMKARELHGQPKIDLSDDYLYSLVNDGRDRGSTLGENMEAITTRGIAPRELVAPGEIYRNKYDRTKADKAALRFRCHEAFTTPSEQEVVAALVANIPVVIAIHVGRNWRRFDSDGVLIGDRGVGNHSEHLDDVRYNRRKGRFEFRKHSSHGKSYGDGGFCWVHWGHIGTVHSSHKKYAVPSAIDDPLGNNPSGSERFDDDTQPPQAKLTMTSSSGCHWCVKWNNQERPKLNGSNVAIISGDVEGSGVPRFRLTVGDVSETHVGYWPADKIKKQLADMRLSALT